MEVEVGWKRSDRSCEDFDAACGHVLSLLKMDAESSSVGRATRTCLMGPLQAGALPLRDCLARELSLITIWKRLNWLVGR